MVLKLKSSYEKIIIGERNGEIKVMRIRTIFISKNEKMIKRYFEVDWITLINS